MGLAGGWRDHVWEALGEEARRASPTGGLPSGADSGWGAAFSTALNLCHWEGDQALAEGNSRLLQRPLLCLVTHLT